MLLLVFFARMRQISNAVPIRLKRKAGHSPRLFVAKYSRPQIFKKIRPAPALRAAPVARRAARRPPRSARTKNASNQQDSALKKDSAKPHVLGAPRPPAFATSVQRTAECSEEARRQASVGLSNEVVWVVCVFLGLRYPSSGYYVVPN